MTRTDRQTNNKNEDLQFLSSWRSQKGPDDQGRSLLLIVFKSWDVILSMNVICGHKSRERILDNRLRTRLSEKITDHWFFNNSSMRCRFADHWRAVRPGIVKGSQNYPEYSWIYLIKSAVFELVKRSCYYPCVRPGLLTPSPRPGYSRVLLWSLHRFRVTLHNDNYTENDHREINQVCSIICSTHFSWLFAFKLICKQSAGA